MYVLQPIFLTMLWIFFGAHWSNSLLFISCMMFHRMDIENVINHFVDGYVGFYKVLGNYI